MNILLYYPRLFIALFVRAAPKSLAAFHHWNMAQLFFLWNEPWHSDDDSIAVETIRRISKPQTIIHAGNPEVRRSRCRVPGDLHVAERPDHAEGRAR